MWVHHPFSFAWTVTHSYLFLTAKGCKACTVCSIWNPYFIDPYTDIVNSSLYLPWCKSQLTQSIYIHSQKNNTSFILSIFFIKLLFFFPFYKILFWLFFFGFFFLLVFLVFFFVGGISELLKKKFLNPHLSFSFLLFPLNWHFKILFESML